jgi:LysR family hca operon transcriptional activator
MAERLDVAFMRAEPKFPELEYISIATEPFIVVMPSDHRLARQKEIDVKELAKETFIGMSDSAGPIRKIIEDFLKSKNLKIEPAHRIHNLAMAMSLIASTRGVSLLPIYAKNFLPWSVTSRPLKGKSPVIDLTVGYKKTNTSPVLETFLANIERLKKVSRA